MFRHAGADWIWLRDFPNAAQVVFGADFRMSLDCRVPRLMFNVLDSKAEKTARQLVSYGTQHLGMPFSTVDSSACE